jgi:hypothetical protein
LVDPGSLGRRGWSWTAGEPVRVRGVGLVGGDLPLS